MSLITSTMKYQLRATKGVTVAVDMAVVAALLAVVPLCLARA